jgi:PAS domain-containing protein
MKKNRILKEEAKKEVVLGSDFFKHFWGESWTYIKTVVDVVREPILILDKELKVIAANESFYHMFQVTPKDTEKKLIYDLGNGQWDIPSLRTLLEDILPKESFFKGYEVVHTFPKIGDKTMILNARHIYFTDETSLKSFPPIIMLALEDVTEIMAIASTLARHTNQLEKTLVTKTKKMELQIHRLENQVRKVSLKNSK